MKPDRADSKKPPVLRIAFVASLAALLGLQLVLATWSSVSFVHIMRVQLGLGVSPGTMSELTAVRRSGGYRITGAGGSTYDAGLRAGDFITEVNGRRLKEDPGALFSEWLRAESGDTLSLAWLHEGLERRGKVTLSETPSTNVNIGNSTFTASPEVAAWGLFGSFLVFGWILLLLAAGVGLMRPRDDAAFHFSVFLLLLGLAVKVGTYPLMILWPFGLPVILTAAGRLANGLLAYFAVRMFAEFPNRTRIGAVVLRVRWVVLAFFGLLALGGSVRFLARVHPGLEPLLPAADLLKTTARGGWPSFAMLALVGGLVAGQWLEARGSSARRTRAVEIGLLLLFIAMLSNVVSASVPWNENSRAQMALAFLLAQLLPILLACVGLLWLAHAIVANRVFGFRLALRRGLQHLLLSRSVLLGEFVVLFLLVIVALRRSSLEFSGSVPAVASLALTSAGLIVVGLGRINRPLMTLIDRRFFVEAYDARRVLLGIGQQISRLIERDRILEHAGGTVMAAVHPARLAILSRLSEGPGWSALWSRELAGRSAQPRESQPVAEELAALEPHLAGLGTGTSWVDLPLTREEVDTARDSASPPPFELLIPIAHADELLGCIALAGKLSEEPYSREDKELLQAVATQMGLALKNAELLEVAKREAQQARDIEIARRVQQSLFPQTLPAAPGWELAAMCRPARAVGGDYYDLFEAGPGRIALALGDVTGKGLGASLLTASLHAIVRSQLPQRVEDLAQLMAAINEHLVGTTPAEIFATLFVGVLDVRSGELRYVNAGHPAPVMMRAGGGAPELLTEGGTIAGILPGATYAEGRVGLSPGDVVLVYSDGLSEATDVEERMYEEERVVASLRAAAVLSAGEAQARLLVDVDEFVAGAEQSDDISLIVVRRTAAVAGDSGRTAS